jgi:hypothetical protein
MGSVRPVRLTRRGEVLMGIARCCWYIVVVLAAVLLIDLVQGVFSHLLGVSNIRG